MNVNRLIMPIFAILLFLSTCSFASEESVSLKEIFKVAGLEYKQKEISSGDIITFDRQDQEKIDTSIALSMGIYVKAPFNDVVKELRADENRLSNYQDAMTVHIKDTKNLSQYFKNVIFTKREQSEVSQLYDYEDGNSFNLSEKEIKKLKLMRNNKQDHSSVAATFFREILEQRADDYIKYGIKGIEAYKHSSKDATVAEGFKSSSKSMGVFKKWFPKLYHDYINYPNTVSKTYKQKFYLIKDQLEGRVTFILKHQMAEQSNNFLVIAERQFYISHDLDAIQTQILCFPYKDGTFIALSSQSFTDKVSGFGRSIAVKIGRKMMLKEILPVFESLQKKFNH